jgi:hypothetical protein
MKFSLPLTALACAMLSTSALADLTLERTTSLSDSFGGSLSITTSGTVEIPGANTTSQATLTNFHPHDDQELVANGSVTRSHERTDGTSTSIYNGTLTLTGTDKDGNPVNDSLTLQGLQVVRDGDGPMFSGTIVLNGSTIDASQMDDGTKHLLHRVLRFFAFD